MSPRNCPICNAAPDSAVPFIDRRLDPSRVSALSFASRKPPEFMCHHLIRCLRCDLIYADDPPNQETLARAYHESSFDSPEEAEDAAAAYGSAIEAVLSRLGGRGDALEIGTGTGAFLVVLRKAGFERVLGIEPSPAAIASAPTERRAWITEGMFRPGQLTPRSFDLVCCFMTLEHVREPRELIVEARRLLRPGGAIALVTHDWRAPINRLLGGYSPIIDIEHLQLFSSSSLHRLLENAGFKQIDIKTFRNRYALRYWLRLLPMPDVLKRSVNSAFQATGLAPLKLSVNVGNLLASGFVPDSE